MTDTGDAAVEAGREAHHTAREVTDTPPAETVRETHTEVTVTEDSTER